MMLNHGPSSAKLRLHNLMGSAMACHRYSGIGVVLMGAAPGQAMFFSGMSLGAAQFKKYTSEDNANFLSGLSGQLFGSSFWVPMEVVKEKLMIQGQMKTKQAYSGSIDLISKVLKSEGMGGLSVSMIPFDRGPRRRMDGRRVAGRRVAAWPTASLLSHTFRVWGGGGDGGGASGFRLIWGD